MNNSRHVPDFHYAPDIMVGLTVDDVETTQRVRLHITPFNPDLLGKVLAPSVQQLASDISFHTVQTFPERGFGYVDLPAMEAQKLKKKLNGSTLKGAKVRVEDAKPEKKRKSDAEEDDETASKTTKRARKEKKKREEGVLPGHELEEGRHVKRGWTDGGARGKKSKQKQYELERNPAGVQGKKLRFKTTVSPIAAPVEARTKDTSKKSKEGKRDKKKVVVEEFSKTSKPTTHSRTDSAMHGALSYVNGKGWVDEAGNVVESERPSRKREQAQVDSVKERRVSAIESREVEEDATAQTLKESDDIATNEGAARDEADSEMKDEDKKVSSHSENSVSGDEEATKRVKEVHPLEALFKRPVSSPTDSTKLRPTPINTSFNFFDSGAPDKDEDAGASMPPQTPHTKQDLEWRSIRSAAPTPDTAAIGRHFSFPFAEEDDDEDDEGEAEEGQDAEMLDADQAAPGATQANGQGRGEESAFRKWFYENRGDLNRGWKKRRREERKSKRQQENRRLNRRVA